MLNAKENLVETLERGNPNRFSNGYEGVYQLPNPYVPSCGLIPKGSPDIVNPWGVTITFPDYVPGPFPVHTPDKIVIKDIEHWKDYLVVPPSHFPEAEWEAVLPEWEALDRTKALAGSLYLQGLFERTHYLMGMEGALCAYMENPDEMKELIKVLTEFEIGVAEDICDHGQLDCFFHQDDWGTERAPFMNPDMFAEFFLEPYQEIYKYYHSRGVKYIFHHSDATHAELVPIMIEMGIDVWQGPLANNNIPELCKKYGDKIIFMGHIDNKMIDFEGWTREDCERAAKTVCDQYELGDPIIPCITQGGPGAIYTESYVTLVDEVDKYNAQRFGLDLQEIKDARAPLQVFG